MREAFRMADDVQVFLPDTGPEDGLLQLLHHGAACLSDRDDDDVSTSILLARLLLCPEELLKVMIDDIDRRILHTRDGGRPVFLEQTDQFIDDHTRAGEGFLIGLLSDRPAIVLFMFGDDCRQRFRYRLIIDTDIRIVIVQ